MGDKKMTSSLEKSLNEIREKVEVRAKVPESERLIREAKMTLYQSIKQAKKIIKSLNKFEMLGYETISGMPTVRVAHTIDSMLQANQKVKRLIEELQQELDDRTNLERLILIDDAIKKCPSGKMVEVRDKDKYGYSLYNDRLRYNNSKDRRRNTSLEIKGKVVAIATTPEQLEKLIEGGNWGFNPLNTETRYF